VINLAGAPLAGKRWTTARRKELFDSRLGVTTRLVTALRAARTRPRVLLSASAIGRYAQRGAASITEDAAAGRDLRASLCEAWEAAAIRAMDVGETRVAVLRFGVVLGRDGGLLGSVAPIFRLGLGGPLGSGQQFLSWIHLRDAISVITTALGDSRYAGAINVVSPEAVTQETFAGSLARALGRPAFIRVPPLALRMLLGDAARIVTDSHRVVPVRLQQFGFVFRFANLETALADLTRRR
jgi:hypothetical protein